MISKLTFCKRERGREESFQDVTKGQAVMGQEPDSSEIDRTGERERRGEEEGDRRKEVVKLIDAGERELGVVHN